jgi:nucleoside-diphosphate-sugar epimerase
VMLLPDPHFWNGRAVTVTGGAGFLGQALVGKRRTSASWGSR